VIEIGKLYQCEYCNYEGSVYDVEEHEEGHTGEEKWYVKWDRYIKEAKEKRLEALKWASAEDGVLKLLVKHKLEKYMDGCIEIYLRESGWEEDLHGNADGGKNKIRCDMRAAAKGNYDHTTGTITHNWAKLQGKNS
jgi:hypothetical protein